MPFDALAMAAVADELRASIAGGRIQRIIQPSTASVGLSIYAGGKERWLLLSADSQLARVHKATGRLAKAFATPSSFVMLLRKHLEGARLASISQVRGERILHLGCQRGVQRALLVAEVMGRHSNLVLLDDSQRILGAAKIVPAHQSRVRPIVPGQPYRPPPAQDRDSSIFPPGPRLDPRADGDSCEALLRNVPPQTVLRTALLGLLSGCGPFLADQIALRAGCAPTAPVESGAVGVVIEAAQELYRLQESHGWQPCTFVNQRRQADFAPYLPLNMSEVQPVASISEAIERCLGALESRDALGASRAALLREVERAQRAAQRKLTSLREGLEATFDAEAPMQQGQLILAYQHAAVPGSAELSIPDLGLTLRLDPHRTPTENAERLFRRYRKLREAKRRLPSLIREAETEVSRLDDLATFIQLAGSEAELAELRRDSVRDQSGLSSGKEKQRKARGPKQISLHGYTLLIGRNARENEEVTFRLARRNDLWLHARGRTGAHVVIRVPDGEVNDTVIERAAQVAAHFSEATADTKVDVDIARVRDVRKIPGGAPGRVTYRNFRTVRVEPRPDY